MSTHTLQTYAAHAIRPHPNADRLEILDIPNTPYQSVIQKDSVKIGDVFAFVEPDYVVPLDKEPFASMGLKHSRIRAIKLRGEVSYGLVLRSGLLPDVVVPGDCLLDFFGVTRYEPIMKGDAGKPGNKGTDDLSLEQPPSHPAASHKYDVEALHRTEWEKELDGDQFVVTQKIHGTNARYLCVDGVMYAGSRNRWVCLDKPSLWKRAMEECDGIEKFCQLFPNHVLVGEIYGSGVQSMDYGMKRGAIDFVAFDVIDPEGNFLSYPSFVSNVLTFFAGPPELFRGSLEDIDVQSLVNLEDLIYAKNGVPKHFSEGIVIKPLEPKARHFLTRKTAKVISDAYTLSGK